MEDFDAKSEDLLLKFRYPLLILFLGLILVGLGLLFYKSGYNLSGTKVEVLNATTEGQTKSLITVEVSGEVEKPGVYTLEPESRIEDALILAGGISANADRLWVEKYLNRAAKLSDGQKVYIPKVNKQSESRSANVSGGDQTVSTAPEGNFSGLVNINAASPKELDRLPGIGPVYAQNIIDHRPYSDTSELLSKAILRKSVYENIKSLITVY